MSMTEPAPTPAPAALPSRPRRLRRRSGAPLRGLLPLVAALVLWEAFGSTKSPYFPSPSAWVSGVRPLMDHQVLLHALGWTSLTFLLGLSLATVLGAVLGTLVGASRRLDRAFGPTLESLRVLPAASLVPLAALIFGYTMQMKLAVVVLPATWPILLSTRAARRSLSSVLIDVSVTLGLTRRDRVRKVLVPALTPAVLLGIRVSAPLALIITLLVELVTRVNGLGALLGKAQANFLSAQVYGLLAIAAVLASLVNWAVTRSEAAVSLRMTGRTHD